MAIKFKFNVEEVEDLVADLAGDDIIPLVELLKGKKNISEFKLAEKLNVTVNQIRNMLYRLYKFNLVEFIRKKDKKKGWYIYYWTFNVKNIKETIINEKNRKLKKLKNRLEKEQENQYYICPNSCMRMSQEDAMEFSFRCQECGELMKEQNNKRTIENLNKMINKLIEELEEHEKEEKERILKIKKKIEREKIKKEEEEKKKLEEKRRKARERAARKRKIAKRKEGTKKKTTKKKTTKKKPVKKKTTKKKTTKKKPVKKKTTKKKTTKKKPVKKKTTKKKTTKNKK